MTAISNMIMSWIIAIRFRMENFLKKETGEVNIIAIVVLIGIAILLALLFKDRVMDLINSLFDTIDSNAQNAVN